MRVGLGLQGGEGEGDEEEGDGEGEGMRWGGWLLVGFLPLAKMVRLRLAVLGFIPL